MINKQHASQLVRYCSSAFEWMNHNFLFEQICSCILQQSAVTALWLMNLLVCYRYRTQYLVLYHLRYAVEEMGLEPRPNLIILLISPINSAGRNVQTFELFWPTFVGAQQADQNHYYSNRNNMILFTSQYKLLTVCVPSDDPSQIVYYCTLVLKQDTGWAVYSTAD